MSPSKYNKLWNFLPKNDSTAFIFLIRGKRKKKKKEGRGKKTVLKEVIKLDVMQPNDRLGVAMLIFPFVILFLFL